MRDDRNGAPNGHPGPGRNGVAGLGGGFTRVLPVHDAADAADAADTPLDLVAVQADDELVNAVGAPAGGTAAGRPGPGTGGGGPRGGDDRLVAMLAAWRAEIDAEPIPELVDLDDAVAAVMAGVQAQDFAARRRRAGRYRHLAPLVAAAAIIVATVGGVGLGSQNAMPGDALWSVQKVVNPERAGSVEAKVAVEAHLQKVRAALQQGDTVTAAQELDAIRTQIPAVRGEEGLPLLVQEQEFLAAKLADTPPGTSANLSTPPKSNPAARSTGTPAAPPASDVPPSGALVTAPGGSPASSAPGPIEPDPQTDRSPDPAIVPPAPGLPGGGDESPPLLPDPSEPQVTEKPEVTSPRPDPQPNPQPNPLPDPPGPGNSEGGDDGSTAPGPVQDPPASEEGAAPGGGAGTVTTSDTATASGSAGASVETTATGSTTN